MRIYFLLATGFFLPFLSPDRVFAHAFGQVYTLPLPAWMYIYGGAGVVFLSFLLIGHFFSGTQKSVSYKTKDITAFPVIRFFRHPIVILFLKILSVFLLFFTILTGIVGTQSSSFNFNMTFFWIIFLVGFTYLIAIIGNVWETLNPWQALVRLLENYVFDGELRGLVSYPKWLSYIPAFLLYFILIWQELLGMLTPVKLSYLLLTYTTLTIAASILFGSKTWFHYGEFFNVFFKIIGKIGIFEGRRKKIYLRWPFAGLLTYRPTHLVLILFILFMLSSTAYDGFRETILWFSLFYDFLGPIIPLLGEYGFRALETVIFLLTPFLFLTLYVVVIGLMKILTKTKLSIRELLSSFAYSLVPIAFVYHVAHYFTLLLIQGQEIIPLVSDPLGFGWNVFNTRSYLPNFMILPPDIVWHLQIFSILLGHIVGVYIAHLVALQLFPRSKQAVVSQLPTLLLMVIYTMVGLWILSQPLTVGG